MSPHRRTRTSHLLRLTVIAVAASGLVAAGTPVSSYAEGPGLRTGAASPRTTAAGDTPKTVLSQRVIGYSVRGHAIRAYEMGSRSARRTAVFIGAMHGNETDGSVVVSALMNGKPIRGVHVWAIRRDNVDGVLAGTRRNAHDVDLNRNFPTKWKRLSGNYNSGPRPRSEPETRALMRFLNRVDPDYVVTMHSPLHGIDVYDSKDRRLARRLSENMHIPIRSFDCGGVCHGTLTQWFNRNHHGACVTVEFGSSPSPQYLRVGAARGIVRAVFGRFLT
jgi:predicted deacylase